MRVVPSYTDSRERAGRGVRDVNVVVHAGVAAVAAGGVYAAGQGEAALCLFATSALLDADHYAYFVLRERSADLREALRFFETRKHTPRFCFLPLHTVEFATLAVLLAALDRSSAALGAAAGVLLHLLLDLIQGIQYKRVRYRWWSALHWWIARPGAVSSDTASAKADEDDDPLARSADRAGAADVVGAPASPRRRSS